MTGLNVMEHYISYLFLTEPNQRGHLGLVFLDYVDPSYAMTASMGGHLGRGAVNPEL